MENSIEIRDLTCRYPSFALEGINLEVPCGTVLGLIGENGAGKSTLIKAVLGLIRPENGSIAVLGEDSTKLTPALKEDIGVVFDELPFPREMTAKQLDRVLGGIFTSWDSKVFRGYLDRFGLPDGKKFSSFSRGMQMRLSLAAAMSHSPRLLVLDEPTGGLDPVIRSEILDMLLEFIQDESHSILISTHITSDLEKIADYVTFLHAGKLLLTKPKDELLWKYGVLRCGEEQFQKLDGSEVLAWQKKDYSYDVLVPDREELLRRYPEAVVDRATMDEILLLYVKGAQKK